MSRALGAWMVLGAITACDRSPDPDPCAEMCGVAADLYGGCLADWGADWTAAGYTDEADFLNACETWAWELRLLEADAVDQGVIDQPGQVDATCEERRDAFAADDATCATYTGTDWNHAPWIPVDEDSG